MPDRVEVVVESRVLNRDSLVAPNSSSYPGSQGYGWGVPFASHTPIRARLDLAGRRAITDGISHGLDAP
jgi:hypothetical protein